MNPSELTLLVLRIGFLLLLWFFVFAIVYALRSDLFGARVRKLTPPSQPAAAPKPAAAKPPAPRAPTPKQPPPHATPHPGPAAPASPPASRKATVLTASTLLITSGPREGASLPLGTEPVTIGRGPDSTLVIRDDYTSTHHARLLLWNNEWMLQDLDSTNGTFLAGRRVTVPTAVPLNTPIKIGLTTFELRT